MTRNPTVVKSLLAMSLASLLASGVAAAAMQSAGSNAASRTHALQHDKNGDGAIQRGEVTAQSRLARHFDAIDSNKDGSLSRDEMHNARRQRAHGRAGWHAAHRGERMAQLDTDGDGRISQAEAAGHTRIAGNFKAIDANHDGYLTRSETRNWVEKQRVAREAERNKRFDERFAAADINRDGKLSKLEVGEKMPRLAASFAWMDDNRDGFLSRAELKPSRHR